MARVPLLLVLSLFLALASAGLSPAVQHTSRFGHAALEKKLSEGEIKLHATTQSTYSFRPHTPFALKTAQSASKCLVHEHGMEPEFMDGLKSFFTKYPSHFPVSDVHTDLDHKKTARDFYNHEDYHVHFSQKYKGVPVYGSFMRVHTKNDAITHVNGVFLPNLKVNVVPTVAESAAHVAALKMTASLFPAAASLSIFSTELVIYHSGLTWGRRVEPTLAYKVLVIDMNNKRNPVQENIFVDAHSGAVIDNHGNIANALVRQLRTGTLDGPLAFDDSNPNNQVQPSSDEAKLLLNLTSIVYNVFMNLAGIDTFDNKSSPMVVVYPIPDDGTPGQCLNAYFTTVPTPATYFCPGFGLFDIAVHEWGHAYTAYTHQLIYQGQSGALNEAYSDILAESVQIEYDFPKDYAPRSFSCIASILNQGDYRWVVGDQATVLAPYYPGGLRDMYNPNCGNYPRTTNDSYIITDPDVDQGGVHTNSGVPNQAYSLLADGGELEGTTVTAIGVIKAYTIYLRAMTVYQGPSTDFKTHATDLRRSCDDLVGQSTRDIFTGAATGNIITAGDCDQLNAALLATKMDADINQADPSAATAPKILTTFPSALEVYATDVEQFTLSFTQDVKPPAVRCLWQGEINCPDGAICIAPGPVQVKDYIQLVGCLLPEEMTVPQDYSFALAPISDNLVSNIQSGTLFERPESTAVSFINNQQEIMIEGTGFQLFTGCIPFENNTDILGNIVDCPSCVFGDLNVEFALAATIVDGTHATCPVPPLSALVNQTQTQRTVWFSLNSFTFYGVAQIDYGGSGTSTTSQPATSSNAGTTSRPVSTSATTPASSSSSPTISTTSTTRSPSSNGSFLVHSFGYIIVFIIVLLF